MKAFRFSEAGHDDIKNEILKLNNNNNNDQVTDIPIKIIKDNVDIFADFLYKNINSALKPFLFPSCLKLADVVHLHKKVKKTYYYYRTVNDIYFFQ